MANLTGSRSNFPQSVDVVRELTDLSANKKTQAQRYQFLKTKEVLSPSEVTELNNLTTELQDYLITAESMNMFGDVVISTQKFFKENVMDFVLDKKQEMTTYTDNKKVEFQAEVDKLNNRGDYNPSIQYFKNNFVFYNDGAINHVYLCLKDCKGKEPSTNPDFWRKLSIQGAKGDDGIGIGLSFNGSWDKSKLYAKNDGVQYGGILFASLVDNNIDNLPDLTQDTDYWAKALDVTITVKKLIGVRNLVSQANTINFMTGEIVAFNKNIDSLEVYQNSVRLTKGVHYNIGLDGQSITKVEGSWDATVLSPIFFEFVVTRNQIGNDLIFSDGQSVANGTITRNKLDVDTQAEIGKVSGIETKVGSGALTTTSQEIVGAINEHEGDIISINTQLAQKANKQQDTWTNLTLLNGWLNFEEQESRLSFYKDQFGRVYLRGSIKSGATSAGTVIATIPAGSRPESICIYAPPTRNASSVWSMGNIYITTDGNINITIAQNNKLILENISFRAGA